jgi:hypothetical protein
MTVITDETKFTYEYYEKIKEILLEKLKLYCPNHIYIEDTDEDIYSYSPNDPKVIFFKVRNPENDSEFKHAEESNEIPFPLCIEFEYRFQQMNLRDTVIENSHQCTFNIFNEGLIPEAPSILPLSSNCLAEAA